MWQLFAILLVGGGQFSYGGPIIVEGFKTEKSCYAHAEKLKQTLPESFKRKAIVPDAVPKFEHIVCIKKEV